MMTSTGEPFIVAGLNRQPARLRSKAAAIWFGTGFPRGRTRWTQTTLPPLSTTVSRIGTKSPQRNPAAVRCFPETSLRCNATGAVTSPPTRRALGNFLRHCDGGGKLPELVSACTDPPKRSATTSRIVEVVFVIEGSRKTRSTPGSRTRPQSPRLSAAARKAGGDLRHTRPGPDAIRGRSESLRRVRSASAGTTDRCVLPTGRRASSFR